MDGKAILALPLPDYIYDDVSTIGEYLRLTLRTLILEGEDFSGKRPLGDSDWDYLLLLGLIRAKVIPGRINEYNEPEDFDWSDFNKAMFKAINAMGTE